jgi:RNase P subunit RPR2
MVLSWLLSLSMNDNANFQVKSICYDRLQSLKQFASEKAKTTPNLKAHYTYAVERINKPKDIIVPQAKTIAPGAPIGCEEN